MGILHNAYYELKVSTILRIHKKLFSVVIKAISNIVFFPLCLAIVNILAILLQTNLIALMFRRKLFSPSICKIQIVF